MIELWSESCRIVVISSSSMKTLYILVFTFALAGAALAQGPGGFRTEQGGERNDIARSVHLYPNPTTEFVHVRIESMNVDHIKVSLHNIIGNEVPIETEKIDEHEFRIRVKDFDAGYYLVAVRDEQTNFRGTYKFLKR